MTAFIKRAGQWLLCQLDEMNRVPAMNRTRSSNHQSPNGALSLLARGTGLIDGGVEIECYSQDSRDLSGQPFTKPSQSREGQYAKIYKPHVLNLSKTYVTQRGNLVLFTSPDDMIIGQACQLHEHERVQRVKSLSRNAVHDIKTTNAFAALVLTYDTEKDSEDDGRTIIKPGNFTSVYIESLTKLTKKMTDDVPEEKDGDVHPAESDSGLDSCTYPTPNGCVSVISYQSELLPTTTDISIPDGQGDELYEGGIQVRFDDNVDFICEDNNYSRQDNSNDSIVDLMASLTASSQNQELDNPSSSKSGAKKKASAGKTSTSMKKAKDDQNVLKTTDSSNCSAKKISKLTKKRSKKQKRGRNGSELTSPNNSQVITPLELASDLTDVNIDEIPEGTEELVLEKTDGLKRSDLQSARAEKRRLEIERKRKEKKELEMQKAQELAMQAELRERLTSYEEEPEINKENVEEKSIISLLDDGMEVPEETTDKPPVINLKELLESEEPPPTTTPLMEKEPSESAVLKKAREAREKAQMEEMKRRESLKEQQMVKELEVESQNKVKADQEHKEEVLREQSIKELGKKLKGKEQLNYKMRLELEAQKHHQQKSPHVFSYFSNIPPKQNKDNSNNNKRRPKFTLKKKPKS